MQIIQSKWQLERVGQGREGGAVRCGDAVACSLVKGTKANKSATCKMLNERSRRCGRQDNIILSGMGRKMYFAYFLRDRMWNFMASPSGVAASEEFRLAFGDRVFKQSTQLILHRTPACQ